MKTDVLRILDANANRAREAMRVIEDYVRFVLDDQPISAAIKQLRHDLAEATCGFVSDAVLHRDVAADVGTSNKTRTELSRENLAAVVVASGKRLGEALRTIEEYLKTLDPHTATKIEAIRYRAYATEQQLAFTLRPKSSHFAHVRLYVLLTESLCRKPWLDVASAAIAGGADCIQLREKNLETGELLKRARALVEICRASRVLCIINDRPDIALMSGADGVHVGQGDLPPRDVRKLIGNDMLLGVSTHSIEQAQQAVRNGADYIGVGPVFRSATKPRDVLPGLDYARQVVGKIKIPAVAIAGINGSNVDEVMSTGIRAVAVSSAVVGVEDPESAAHALKRKLQHSGNGCPKS